MLLRGRIPYKRRGFLDPCPSAASVVCSSFTL